MRRTIMTCAGAVVLLFTATAFAPPLAQGMTIAAPAGLVKAGEAANLTEDVRYVCGWWGRRCWTIGYGYYYRPYYVYSHAVYGSYYYPPYRPWWGSRYRR